MTNRVGRNDPCPCGSGRKYKRCCRVEPHLASGGEHPSPRFRFEAGSYGSPAGFLPSIACLKQVNVDEWEYHFVLARPDEGYPVEDEAIAAAESNLEDAFKDRDLHGSDFAVAEYLRGKGYLRVRGFKIHNG